MDLTYKRLRFKARRGMLELDLTLQKYLDNHYADMSDQLKQQLEQLLDLTDPELLDLLINENNINSHRYKIYSEIIDDIISSK